MLPELSTRKDLAKYFGVTLLTIKNWQRHGLITPEVVVNGRPRYDLQKTIDLLKVKQKQ